MLHQQRIINISFPLFLQFLNIFLGNDVFIPLALFLCDTLTLLINMMTFYNGDLATAVILLMGTYVYLPGWIQVVGFVNVFTLVFLIARDFVWDDLAG